MLSPTRSPAADAPLAPGKILVVDDTPENVRLLQAFLSQEGYEVLVARDGLEAVQCCRGAPPDMIIMDVAMPRLNGYEATREIRRLHPDSWIPIIFLSAHGSEASQTKGLDAGGDDYLVKPVNLAILHEKIKAMRRVAESQARVARYAAQLESRIEEARADQEFAKHLMRHILQTKLDESDGVRQWIEPAENFSGDAILTARGPGGELYVMLADAAGHGLAAAISVLPVIEAFYRLAEKGYSVGSVVRELNRKIRKLMPRERFIAAVVAVVDPAQRSLQIWNGGLPAPCFLDAAGQVVRRWPATHPPLGTQTDDMLRAQPEVFSWQEAGQLLLHTDGLEEAEDAGGVPFSAERARRILCEQPPAARFDALVRAVRGHLGARSAHDDISLVVVDCPTAPAATVPGGSGHRAAAASGAIASAWRFSLRLEAELLRTLDIVPLLMGWLDQLQLAEQHRGVTFMVLAELVNNALDHGLLQLDSSVKQEPNGFERYLNLRTERLSRLESGSIDLAVEHLLREGTPCLEITVRDSGAGFAHHDFMQRLAGTGTAPSGRGIALVQAIAGDLHFRGSGNEAVALLRLPQAAS